MKIRSIMTAILGITFLSGISLAQVSASPELTLEEPLLVEAPSPEPMQEETMSMAYSSAEPRRGRSVSRSSSSSGERMMKIFTLKYYSVEELEVLIENIFSIDGDKIYGDAHSKQLIVQVTKAQMNDIEELISQLDVPDSKQESSQPFENFVYRIFMFEIPSKDQDLKPFSMILQTPSAVPSTEILQLAIAQNIQVSDFLIIDERDSENDILIQGKAPSDESVKEMVQSITPSQIKELKWDNDETFTSNIEAAHYSRLPVQIQKHIKNFLGEDVVTVGYWFGSSSVPGEVDAPIGPWKIRLELNQESDRALELRIEVEVPEERSDFDRRLGRERSHEILSNKIMAKVGKPIIVGYNRQSYGTRKMGAMVIIPETIQLNTSESVTP